MFLPFFVSLRDEGVQVSVREYLTLLEAMAAGLAEFDPEDFYHLARTILVKDETRIDAFDRAFARSFQGLAALSADDVLAALDLPEDWLRRLATGNLTDEEKAKVQALGGFDRLMETLRQRLAEQKGRHQGGSKWIGTAGTSPFGAYGYNPEGIRIGQHESRHRRAVKVWDRREFRDLEGRAELNSRGLKVALRRLRRWAREGGVEELDMEGTIRASAEHGHIDVRTRPERRNGIKVLLFLDIGGSMDDHVNRVDMLFTAAKSAFRHLEHIYFHNCLYEFVWRDNRRRFDQRTPTTDLFHRYGPDWRAIFVGDASMSPYELAVPGGASEHHNPEAGHVWLARAREHWPVHAWINPVPENYWGYTQTIGMIHQQFQGRMFPMSVDGISAAMKAMAR